MALYQLDQNTVQTPGEGHFWVAPSAVVLGNVELQPMSSVWFGAVLRGDNEPIVVGEGTNIQDGCVLHTDPGYPLTLGKNCTVGHMAMVHGCTVQENSLVGIGATILNGSVIGKNCLIGAHTLIPEGKTIPDNSMVMGTPGRVVRELTDDEIAGLTATAGRYVQNWQRFAKGLSKQTTA